MTKKTKRSTKRTKRRNKAPIMTSTWRKRLLVLSVMMIFGTIGILLLNNSFASIPLFNNSSICSAQYLSNCGSPVDDNPPLTQSCQEGLDIAFLIDGSGSLRPYTRDTRNAAISFIKDLEGKPMTYAVGIMSDPKLSTSFTSDTKQAIAYINAGANGGSELGDLQPLLDKDPRPDKQNLFILVTDGQISVHPSYKAVKAGGTRILAMGFGGMKLEILKVIGGPHVNTGSIWTTDVITISPHSTGSSTFVPGKPLEIPPKAVDVAFKLLAKQLCQKPKAASQKPGPGAGNGPTGPGSGPGTGTQTGKQGTGRGKTGTGTGGGGSAANTQGDAANSVPKAAPQGVKEQEPPQPVPSPFFDGKQYAIGSDPDAQTPADLVQHPGKILNNVWFYILGGVVVAGGVGAGVVMWRKGLWVFGKTGKLRGWLGRFKR